jgi:alkylation response protein AidB-like acyl-CoA dehydrogenase
MAIGFRIDTDDEKAFRTEVRDWLQANLPEDLRGLSTRPPFDRSQVWFHIIAERGWIAPHWPKSHGGMAATINQQIILREELANVGAPEISSQGLNHIGPILMEFGTDAQKAQHLPPILAGTVNWCQGYSEPNSGSDLASLRTRADRDGDELVVNGQKIWTTWAQHSDWIFALVRTDQEAVRKQAGISFLLIDLTTPGITIRPIRTIAGDDEFAEVFFEDVRVPVSNIVGEINDGWRVANSLLAHERLNTASPTHVIIALDRVKKIARANGLLDDPAFRDRLAQAELDAVGLAALYSHAVSITASGRGLGPDSSIMKIYSTEALQRTVDLLFEAAGAEAASMERIETDDGAVDVATLLLQVRRATIYGGSSEIQRNILAKRVLGLPT